MGYIEDLRKEIGHRPLILVGVAVAVIDQEGQILLQQRPSGIWGVPGGLMELGESTIETGRREILEETGLQIGKLELLDVFSGKEFFVELSNGDQFYPVTICYRTDDILGGTLKPDGIEGIDVRFFPVHQLPNRTSPLVIKLIEKYRA